MGSIKRLLVGFPVLFQLLLTGEPLLMQRSDGLLLLPLLLVRSKRLQTLCQGLLLLFVQQDYAAGLRLKLLQFATRLLMFFKDLR